MLGYLACFLLGIVLSISKINITTWQFWAIMFLTAIGWVKQ